MVEEGDEEENTPIASFKKDYGKNLAQGLQKSFDMSTFLIAANTGKFPSAGSDNAAREQLARLLHKRNFAKQAEILRQLGVRKGDVKRVIGAIKFANPDLAAESADDTIPNRAGAIVNSVVFGRKLVETARSLHRRKETITPEAAQGEVHNVARLLRKEPALKAVSDETLRQIAEDIFEAHFMGPLVSGGFTNSKSAKVALKTIKKKLYRQLATARK
jgi:hypothetical protein